MIARGVSGILLSYQEREAFSSFPALDVDLMHE